MTSSIPPGLLAAPDPDQESARPKFAHYQEWIGNTSIVPAQTWENARISLEAQGGDIYDSVHTVLRFKSLDHGYLFTISSTITNESAAQRREKMI